MSNWTEFILIYSEGTADNEAVIERRLRRFFLVDFGKAELTITEINGRKIIASEKNYMNHNRLESILKQLPFDWPHSVQYLLRSEASDDTYRSFDLCDIVAVS